MRLFLLAPRPKSRRHHINKGWAWFEARVRATGQTGVVKCVARPAAHMTNTGRGDSVHTNFDRRNLMTLNNRRSVVVLAETRHLSEPYSYIFSPLLSLSLFHLRLQYSSKFQRNTH